MTLLKMLTADDKLAEIKRLYFKTSARTINDDFAKAVELLKTMANDEERERAAVFMDGLAEMRTDWARRDKLKKSKFRQKPKKPPRPDKP
jgi:hypothetical protein